MQRMERNAWGVMHVLHTFTGVPGCRLAEPARLDAHSPSGRCRWMPSGGGVMALGATSCDKGKKAPRWGRRLGARFPQGWSLHWCVAVAVLRSQRLEQLNSSSSAGESSAHRAVYLGCTSFDFLVKEGMREFWGDCTEGPNPHPKKRGAETFAAVRRRTSVPLTLDKRKMRCENSDRRVPLSLIILFAWSFAAANGLAAFVRGASRSCCQELL